MSDTPARLLKSLLAVSLVSVPSLAHADDLDAYAKAVDEHPEDAKAYEAYATAAIAARRYDDAIGKLKVGIARVPDFKRGYYLLAFAYRSKGAWADAAGFYRVCIEVNQQSTEAEFGLGKALEGLGDNKGAIAAFTAYAEHEKDPAKARFVDAAKAEIAKLEPPPAAPTVSAAQLKAEADSLKNQGKLEDAVAAYKKAIAADANNQDLYNDLGNTYFAMRRYGDAAQAFKDATARDANFAIGWYNLANALRKADRKAEAVDAYKKYMALQPNDPDPWYGMAQTLKGMGDTAQAVSAFQKYVQMETRPEQQKWVDKAKAELQQLQAAPAAPSSGGAGGGKIGFDN
jgi:tetratricopeptide (TPR) repeat protein